MELKFYFINLVLSIELLVLIIFSLENLSFLELILLGKKKSVSLLDFFNWILKKGPTLF